METHRREANGKRLFTPEFKREQVGRLARGEVTVAELSREPHVSDSLLRRWKHLVGEGAKTAVAADGEVVPLSALRAAEQRIRELERALGRKTVEAPHSALGYQSPAAFRAARSHTGSP